MRNKKEVPVRRGLIFEIPEYDSYCEKCGTTNFIYADMKPPYKCDYCGANLQNLIRNEKHNVNNKKS